MHRTLVILALSCLAGFVPASATLAACGCTGCPAFECTGTTNAITAGHTAGNAALKTIVAQHFHLNTGTPPNPLALWLSTTLATQILRDFKLAAQQSAASQAQATSIKAAATDAALDNRRRDKEITALQEARREYTPSKDHMTFTTLVRTLPQTLEHGENEAQRIFALVLAEQESTADPRSPDRYLQAIRHDLLRPKSDGGGLYKYKSRAQRGEYRFNTPFGYEHDHQHGG